MKTRSMEIKIVSARDLNNVNFLMKMDVFVVLKLIADGDSKPKHKSKTPVDKEGGHNPNWNFSIKFPIDEFAAKQNRLTLVFTLRCQRNLGDRDIGQVFVPVKELLDSSGLGGGENSMKHLSYQISKPSGNPQGVLNFSYRFDDKPVAVEPPPPPPPPVVYSQPAVHFPPPTVVPEVYPPPSNLYPILPPKDTALQVPVAVPAAGYGVYPPVAPLYSGYMPVHSQYGYQHQTPPPPPVYGYESYPPPPPMYGYPPSAAAGYGSYPPPERKKSNMGMGMGMGLGLGAGLVGGVLIGDFVSDAASYDTGYGDSGGFDF